MAKAFTSGFDIKARLAEGFLSEFAGNLARAPVTKTIQWQGVSHELTVHFHHVLPKPPQLETFYGGSGANALPHLRILPATGDLSRVELHFPFRAMVPSLGFEKTAEARVTVGAQTVSATDGEGNAFDVIVVNLSQLNSGDFDFHPLTHVTEWTDQDWLTWRATDGLPEVFFEQEVKPAVVGALQGIENEPISPRTTSIDFFTFRTYTDGLADTTHQADTAGAKRFVGLFINQEHDPNPPLPPEPFGGPPFGPTSDGTNLRLFVPRETIMPLLDAAKQDAINAVEDVDVDHIDFELKDGFLRVTGEAEGASFEAEVGLSVSPAGTVHANLLSVSIDFPWYVDALSFLPFGNIISEMIKIAAVKGLRSGLGAASSDAFGDLSPFSIDVQQVSGPIVSLLYDVEMNGPITIRTGGIVLPARATTTVDLGQVERPTRAWGHHRSKEFHHAQCDDHHMKMSKKNLVMFTSPARAIENGFNGCAYCYPQYNVNDLDYGFIEVHVHGADANASYLEAALWLQRDDPMDLHDLSVRPSMRCKAYDWSSQTPREAVAPIDLFAGGWTLRVTRGSWEAECALDVPARGTRHYLRVDVQVGSTPCQVQTLPIDSEAKLSIGTFRP